MKKHTGKIVTLATLLWIFGFVAAAYYTINSSVVQKAIIGIVNKTHLQFDFEKVKFDVIRSGITINDLVFLNERTGQTVKAKEIKIKYSLLGLVRGKLQLKELSVNGLDAFFPKVADMGDKKSKIGIKKIFILQSLEIDNGRIEGASLNFAGKDMIIADTLSFEFSPRLTGGVELRSNLQGINYRSEDRNISAGSFSLNGRTKITEWFDLPPYVNSIHGKMDLNDAMIDGISVASVSSKIDIKDKKFQLSELELSKEGKTLNGSLEVDLATERYSVNIDIPDPIPFPTLGGDLPTIDTQGNISGKVVAEGEGLKLERSTGSAKIDLTHSREPLAPVHLKSELTLKKGVITLGETIVTMNEGTVNAKGIVNIPGKKMDISCEGSELPLESVFGRFGDPNFYPIFGTAKATATITGWGNSFHVVADAETTAPGGYYKIITDKARAHIDATYQELNLNGEIEQGGEKAGDIALKIKYGAHLSDGTRAKTLHIEANAINNDLGKSFEAYDLTGIGNAHMVLDGPQRSFSSKINATIDEGSFAGMSFQKLTTKVDMGFKKIKFTEGEILIPNAEPIVFSSPISMDFDPSGFRMYGNPIKGVSFDTNYRSSDLSWRIKNLNYDDISASGTYAPRASSDLNVSGTINGEKLSVFKQYLRDASGPIAVKLKLTGPAANPSLNGKITLNDNFIYPRGLNKRLEKVKGDIILDGHTIRTDSLAGTIDDGPFDLKGYIQYASLSLEKFDLSANCDDLRYVDPDRTLKMEFSADLRWSGTRTNSTLKGNATILDGRYTKDFTILESLTGGQKKEQKSAFLGNDTIHLDLRVKNTGDFRIKNNIGDIWLKIDIEAKGTAAKPLIAGTVETPEGKIHYLDRDFTITKGFVEFKDQYTNPYLEITAEHEVPNITDLIITVTLHGKTDNLTLDLSATKPMEQRDIVSLLLFGVTEQEVKDSQYSAGFGQSMVASQITHMIERPITKLTKLDTFRFESGTSSTSTSSSSNASISKIYLGKQFNDRLNFEFFTDVNSQNSQQNVRANYLLTDYLILKGQSSTDQQYKFNISLRFKER